MFALDNNAWPWLATILILIATGILLELVERYGEKGRAVALAAVMLAVVCLMVVV